MKRSYRVLQVLPALVAGGVERGTVEMATALTANHHEALVASAGGPMVREIEKIGGRHLPLPLDSKNPLTILSNARRLADVIRYYKIDLVHARSRAPAWSAWLAARNTKCPFVTTFHNAYGAANWFKREYNSVMGRGARVIAISQFVGDYATDLYGVMPDRLRVIPRGVDIDQFDPARVGPERIEQLRHEWQLPKGVPVIMLPGRLTRWKGHLVLIEALARMKRKDIICLMIGSGSADYRREIEDVANENDLGAIVRVEEHCRDMPAALMLADVVVSASTRPEGFGRVIAEAQAMGRPVIATDHGGARETVIPGQTGWLVPPRSAGMLAGALTEVLRLTPEERAALGERSIAHIRSRFTTAAMTSATIAVYDELINGTPA
jgi:glycosyltransferase involved in cell wall biosynthesis